jgi:hypothetical protein
MTDLNDVTEFFKKSAEANAEALKIQLSFYESFTRRQAECFAGLADARSSSLSEIVDSGSFDKAVDLNGSFLSDAQSRLEQLHSENAESLTKLNDSLKKLYEA